MFPSFVAKKDEDSIFQSPDSSSRDSELWLQYVYILYFGNSKHYKNRLLPVPGTEVMILKIFSPKNIAKKWAFLTQNKAKF
jgi:hypothetical protein